MEFKDALNNYVDLLSCTSKELAKSCNLAESIISRYRNGYAKPKQNSVQLDSLIKGLSMLVKKKGLDITEKDIEKQLVDTLPYTTDEEYTNFLDNFNYLIYVLNIKLSSMAKFINYDSSFLSKIKTGERKPRNKSEFIISICKFVIANYNDNKSNEIIADLLKCEPSVLDNEAETYNKLFLWLTNNKKTNDNYSNDFLNLVDAFNITDYVSNVKLLDTDFYTSNFTTKNYYGIEGMKEAQLSFLSKVSSTNCEELYVYYNISTEKINSDDVYISKFTKALNTLVNKGVEIYIILDIDKPIKDTTSSFSSWLPFFMSGKVHPFFLKVSDNSFYSHIDCVADTASLSGKCLVGFEEDMQVYLTDKEEELEFHKRNIKALFDRAKPLIDIYREDNKSRFIEALKKCSLLEGDRYNKLSKLPNYTLSDELLERLLDKNKLSEEEKDKIKNYIRIEKEAINNISKNNKVLNEIRILPKEEFINSNYSLGLSRIFFKKSIKYDYDDYLEHLRLTREYSKTNPNYSFIEASSNLFKGIDICVVDKRKILISKETEPTIHFFISNKKLIEIISKL